MNIKKMILQLSMVVLLFVQITAGAETAVQTEKTTIYPMLAPSDSWYRGSHAKSYFTAINFVDIADNETVSSASESWSAATDSDGDGAPDSDIMCYVNGSELTVAGNGSGQILMNYDSSCVFSDSTNKKNYFSSITEITGMELLDTENVTTMEKMFWNAWSLSNIDVSGFNTSNVTSMSYMFASNTSGKAMSFKSLDVGNWNTENVTNMNRVFQLCSSVEKLDVANWDTSNVTVMSGMFLSCKSLSELDLSKWDTKNVEDLSFMFHCEGTMPVGTVDVSGWDVSKVLNFDHFTAHSELILTGVENWKNTVVQNMNAMFHTCRNTRFDVSGFRTANVTTFDQMFENCTSLTEIKGLENFDTSNAIGFSEMFAKCPYLTKLNLESFDTRKAKNGETISGNGNKSKTLYNMFANTLRLREIRLGENFSFNGDGSNTVKAYEGALRTPSGTYISGADGKWYNENCVAFAAADIPDKTKGTYYAVHPETFAFTTAKYTVEESKFDVAVLVGENLKKENSVVIIALYDSTSMVRVICKNAAEISTHTFENLPFSKNGYTVRAFCLANRKDLVPLCRAIEK